MNRISVLDLIRRRYARGERIAERLAGQIVVLEPLAPLHNAPALKAIEEAQRALPDVRHVAVFDTAFHATMPEEAAVYAVPEQWRGWGVHRFGLLVFTAGIGEGSALVRARVCERLRCLGVELDTGRNDAANPDCDIAGDSSPVRVVVVHAREELVAARAARTLLG